MESGITPELKSETSMSFVGSYFRDLKKVLFEPSEFFQALPVKGGLAIPLTFALVTHWVGSVLNYMFSAVTGDLSGHFFDRFVQFSSQYSSQLSGSDIDSPGKSALINQGFLQAMGAGEKIANWLWGASGILLDPFFTLLWLIFISFFVFIGARLLVKATPEHLIRFPNGGNIRVRCTRCGIWNEPGNFYRPPLPWNFRCKTHLHSNCYDHWRTRGLSRQ